jgi:transposase
LLAGATCSATCPVAFMEPTSLYFEGRGAETLGQNSHSKDFRPHLKQMIVGIIMDQDGRPVCSEMWPGNITDVTTLIPVIDGLRQRFAIGRVCVVADRGTNGVSATVRPRKFTTSSS